MRKFWSCVGFLAATLTLGLGGDAVAGSIVQTVRFSFAEHGTSFGGYAQFDPALGPLLEVDIAFAGTGRTSTYTFRNQTAAAITFGGSIALDFTLGIGPGAMIRSSFVETLAAFQVDTSPHSASASFSQSEAHLASSQSLAAWIGAGFRGPDISPINRSGTADAAGIMVSSLDDWSLAGTETVTYIYGAAIPEPSSIWMLGIGLLLVPHQGMNSRRRNRNP